MKDKQPPLFMMAQLPFNSTETVELNTPMTLIMDDVNNTKVAVSNLKELGIYKEILKQDSRLLEIGCGRGYLLEHFYQKGIGQYYGIEPIESEYKIAKEKLKSFIKKDEKILQNGILETVNLSKQKFDFIYSYHVFEHIENPLDMLEFGKKHLNKNGKMIITCPNVEGYIPKQDINTWRCSIVSHRWLPGKSTLSNALERNGYKIEKLFTYGGHPAPRSLFENISNYYFKKRNLGDVICIMASLK